MSLQTSVSEDALTPFQYATQYRYSTAAHRILAWPAVKSFLQREQIHIPEYEGEAGGGTTWLIRLSDQLSPPLATDERLDLLSPSHARSKERPELRSIPLSLDTADNLSTVFFRSFHLAYPILVIDTFLGTTLPMALDSNFEGEDSGTILALLVLALGAVAIEGFISKPLTVDGRVTGLLSADPTRPPGLVFAIEASRKIGMILTQATLETTQCFALLA